MLLKDFKYKHYILNLVPRLCQNLSPRDHEIDTFGRTCPVLQDYALRFPYRYTMVERNGQLLTVLAYPQRLLRLRSSGN